MTCPIHGCEMSYSVTSSRVCPKCEAKAAHRKEQAEHQAAYDDACALAETWTREELLVQWRNAYDAVQVLTKCIAEERARRTGGGA